MPLRSEAPPFSRTRERILGALAARPGSSEADLFRLLETGRGTVRHHIDALLRDDRLVRVAIGRQWHFFPAEMELDRCTMAAPLLHRAARQALAIIVEAPGTIKTEIARRLGVTRRAATNRLKILEAAGFVRGVRRGRCVGYEVGHAFDVEKIKDLEAAGGTADFQPVLPTTDQGLAPITSDASTEE